MQLYDNGSKIETVDGKDFEYLEHPVLKEVLEQNRKILEMNEGILNSLVPEVFQSPFSSVSTTESLRKIIMNE